MQEKNKTPGPSGVEQVYANHMEAFARNMVRLFDQGTKAFSALAERTSSNGQGPYSMASEAGEAAKSLGEIARHWVAEPAKFATAQSELLASYADLWGRSVPPLSRRGGRARRRAGARRQPLQGSRLVERPGLRFLEAGLSHHLALGRGPHPQHRGVDDKTRKKALFYLNQMLSAMSPSNFPLTNPEVIRTTLATNAENLVQGMTHFVEDLGQSKDLLRISQTDLSAFEIGRNLAVTPGKVVFQNDLIQLIQYAPTTEEVYERPLLVVPPWINKYYILDLVPEKSFVKWAVEQGFTVFLVSWVNPDIKLAQKTFEDYMREGILGRGRGGDPPDRQPEDQCARLLRRRHAARFDARLHGGEGRQPHRLGKLPRRPGRFQRGRRSARLHRRRAAQFARGDDGRAGLSRRLAHGGGVQHAAPARSDLALRHQQLSARQEALPVRSAVLECRLDQAAGRKSRLLSARVLSSEPAGQGRDAARRRAGSISRR